MASYSVKDEWLTFENEFQRQLDELKAKKGDSISDDEFKKSKEKLEE